MKRAGGGGMIDNLPIQSPKFVMRRDRLQTNLEILAMLQRRTGIKILHTLKSFHESEALEIMSEYISGFSAGNQNELDTITSPKDSSHIHIYTPAFRDTDVESLAKRATTMSFNSIGQWMRHSSTASPHCSIGVRINPQLQIIQPHYCDPNKAQRLGVPYRDFLAEIESHPELWSTLEGLHLHLFCTQGVDSLRYLLEHITREYHHILPQLKWLNLGGGHNLTDDAYQHDEFITIISELQATYPNLTIILEPGESVVRQTGYLATTILDIIPSQPHIAIIDTSIETHLLDIAITKQSPQIRGTTKHKTPYQYQLSGMSCIAGDIIGVYHFEHPLHIGDTIIIEDMMGYSIVKQTEFNGIDRAGFEIV